MVQLATQAPLLFFCPPKTKAPQTQLSQGRSLEQLSPEVCSLLAYVLTCRVGRAPTFTWRHLQGQPNNLL